MTPRGQEDPPGEDGPPVVVISEDLDVDAGAPLVERVEGHQVWPTARGRVTVHELTEDVDGRPLGVSFAGRACWEVGDVLY